MGGYRRVSETKKSADNPAHSVWREGKGRCGRGIGMGRWQIISANTLKLFVTTYSVVRQHAHCRFVSVATEGRTLGEEVLGL